MGWLGVGLFGGGEWAGGGGGFEGDAFAGGYGPALGGDFDELAFGVGEVEEDFFGRGEGAARVDAVGDADVAAVGIAGGLGFEVMEDGVEGVGCGEREKTATCDNTPSPRPSGERVAGGRERGSFVSLDAFSEIRYPPVASVVLGFRREDVAHPCEGFGMLIPKVEGFKILGTIFSSSLFPNRAPAGHLTLTSYVGGERFPELASLSPERLFALTCEDLRVLLGVKGKPTFQHSVFYPRAIPQYNVGYGRYREQMADIEKRAPGLFLAGHYRDGISLSDRIVSACNVADRVREFLGSAPVGQLATQVPA